jgi:hypothetical protein
MNDSRLATGRIQRGNPSNRHQTDARSGPGWSNLIAVNLKSVCLSAMSVGKEAAVSSRRFGLRLQAAAKAAAAAMRGSDEVALKEQQILVWNAAMEAASFECEQAARALTLSNPTDDPRAQTNIIADSLIRQAARIRLLNTRSSRGRRFFAERLEIPSV